LRGRRSSAHPFSSSGTADAIVSPKRALEFAPRLQAVGATYELVSYANDGHGLTMNRRDSDRRVVEWLRKYMRKFGFLSFRAAGSVGVRKRGSTAKELKMLVPG